MSAFEPTKDAPFLVLTGEPWGVIVSISQKHDRDI